MSLQSCSGQAEGCHRFGQIGKVLAIRGTNRGRCPFDWFVQLPLSGGGAVIDHTVHVN